MSKTEGNTLYSTELTMDTAYSYGNGSSTSGYYVPDLTTDENNYYFLGYAAYMDNGSITDSTDGTLTFTDIAINTTTFNDSNTYYAIWGTGVTAEISSVITGTTGTNIPISYTYYDETSESYETIYVTLSNTDGSFYAWYGDSNFTTTENILLNDTYIYYARMSFTLSFSFNGKDTKITIENESDSSESQTATQPEKSSAKDFSFNDGYTLFEGFTLSLSVKITQENGENNFYTVKIIINNSITYNLTGVKNSSTSTKREFGKDSDHYVTINNETQIYYDNGLGSNGEIYDSQSVNTNIEVFFKI